MRILEKVLAILVFIMMILLLAGMTVRDPADPNVGPELSAFIWEAADGEPLAEGEVSLSDDAVVTVATDRAVIFHGTVGETLAARIVVLPGVNGDITLDNVSLQPTAPQEGSGLSALELGGAPEGEQTVKLTLKGENILRGSGPASAVTAGENARLTIASEDGGTLEAAAGDPEYPALGLAPTYDYDHVTVGSQGSTDPSSETVENTGASRADWSGLGWIKTQPAEIAGLVVTGSAETAELNGADAVTVQFTAAMEVSTANGPVSLPVTDPVEWSLSGAAGASFIDAGGVLTVDPAETATALTVTASCGDLTGAAAVTVIPPVTPEPTEEPTPTPEPTEEPTPTPEPTPEPTPTPTPEPTPTPTPEPTPTPTPEPTPTPTPEPTPTPTPEPTPTPTPEPTPTPTPEPTPTPTPEPTPTPTPEPTPTPTPEPTPTPTPEPTLTPTPTPTATPTPTPTATPEVPAPTATPEVPAPISDPTPTPSPTPTLTPVNDVPGQVTQETGTPAITLPGGDVLAQTVLTEADRQLAAAGTAVSVKLDVRAKQATAAEAEQVTAAARGLTGEVTVADYLDVTLFKVEGASQTLVNTPLSGAIRLVIQVPEDLRSPDRTFAVVRVHNGTASLLPDLDTDPNTVTISTDRFSLYALVYAAPASTATPVPATATPAPVATSAPTGDENGDPAAYLALLALCAVALTAVTLITAKRRKG